ncbi:ROK family protein [Flavimaricola marinus]|uniref:N-acetyl-D-glucosamine kinase n=1 Tax=Flavimaricola marinus TaxID=1819565 RepID=A0A238LAR3_9RHOB|nr:ROK family protein [Flavimaricola marinus]SMY06662.1 N-acetyl-D-glucosamine kinase [Flavimaricola marinus]
MRAAGIDLGGTKIETQIFDADWQPVTRQRVPTPKDYAGLVKAVADQVRWAEAAAGEGLPIGIGAAGLVNPATGLALTANLVASGHPFPADITAAAGRDVLYVNDCRALALSEAVFGAGRGYHTVLGLILGTGIGGGISIGGHLLPGPSMTGGEFGHTSAPADLVAKHRLPVVPCGCGAMGCIETLIAGPGLARVALAMTGQELSPPAIAAAKGGEMAAVWQVWCDLVAALLRNLTLTVDPDIIVLGGGLSQIPGVTEDLTTALQSAQLAGFAIPKLAVAQGGDSSGARGAAYAAWTAQRSRQKVAS